MDLAGNQPSLFHPAQGLGEHFLGDAIDQVHHLRGAFAPGREVTDDHRRPFVRHDAQDAAGTADRFTHGTVENVRRLPLPGESRNVRRWIEERNVANHPIT